MLISGPNATRWDAPYSGSGVSRREESGSLQTFQTVWGFWTNRSTFSPQPRTQPSLEFTMNVPVGLATWSIYSLGHLGCKYSTWVKWWPRGHTPTPAMSSA